MTVKKIWPTVTLGLTITAILLLAASLPQLELRPGTFFDEGTTAELKFLLNQFVRYRNLGLVLLFFGLLAVFVLYMSTKHKAQPDIPVPRRRRSLLAMLLQAILLVVTLMIIRRQIMEGKFDLSPLQTAQMPSFTSQVEPRGIVAQIPDWMAFAFSFGLILMVIVLVFWRAWKRRRPSKERALDLVIQEAQSARQALQAGADFRNVILRCYYEMGRVLDRQRGIRREDGMTPREFEKRLVALGLPQDSVGQLTRLFELVRYGAKDPGEGGEHRALACLDEVVRASGGKP